MKREPNGVFSDDKLAECHAHSPREQGDPLPQLSGEITSDDTNETLIKHK